VLSSAGNLLFHYYTIINLDNGQFGLSSEAGADTTQKTLSTEAFDARITNSSFDTLTGYFQVQVYMRFKQNFPSIYIGEVFIINSVYNPSNNLFQTTVQYPATPNPMVQSNRSSEKSKCHKNVKTSRNGSCDHLSDNVYVCYNSDKSRR
jgi:hypothetical protein